MAKHTTGCHICKYAKPKMHHGRKEVLCLLDNMFVMHPSTGCFCFKEKAKVATNGDRIRAMSDEELAVFLCNNASCETCNFRSTNCREKRIEWLRKEVDEGESLRKSP